MNSTPRPGRPKRERPLPELVGAQIRTARDAEGLTQGELAEGVGRTRAAVSLWEAGERMPSVDDLLAVAAVLDRPVEFFLPSPADEPTRETAAVSLRAVAVQLSGTKVGSEVARAIREVEKDPAPTGSFRPRSRDPIESAQELLSAMRATRPPIDVDHAADICGVGVIRQHFSSDALSGFLLHLGDRRTIGVNALHSDGRQRFTLAHELGHLVLGHHADFHIDLFSPVSAGDPPEYDWRHERAANTFAANLLMPAGMVQRDRVEGKQSLTSMARRYQVSEEAMGIRLTSLGLS